MEESRRDSPATDRRNRRSGCPREHAAASGAQRKEGHTITTHMPGIRLVRLSAEDKWAITPESLSLALKSSKEMAERGVVPNDDIGWSMLFDPETGRLRFTDMLPIENSAADPDQPVQTVANVYDSIVGNIIGLRISAIPRTGWPVISP